MGKNLYDQKWETRFQQLVDYKRVHGNCNVPYDDKANKQLGRWVKQQRNAKTIARRERKRLKSIGLPGTFGKLLVEYKQFHEICNVSKRYKANKQVGEWAATQRKNKETMSEYKIS